MIADSTDLSITRAGSRISWYVSILACLEGNALTFVNQIARAWLSRALFVLYIS